jgi:hypothetical protein
MIVTPWLPTVRKIKDGEPVDQATVNVPIDQMTQREQHLYEKFEELKGKSVLISFGQPIYQDPDSLIEVGEMSVVYYKKDLISEGLAKGTTGFSSSSSSSMFSPNDSNYSFGILKTVYQQAQKADVFIEGLCEFQKDIDDPNYGLIQAINGVVEEFKVGPYFLSPKVPGKITRDPSGIPVYMGYAISKRKFLLHTNVDEFSQFFINYRYHVLDRVAGKPTKSQTNVWTIAEADETKLGWVPASLPGVAIPTGAKFFYNIPNSTNISTDAGLDYYILNEGEDDEEYVYFEKEEALELNKYLPPIPANFIQLYVNGILMRYKDAYDTSGTYSLNEYGLWWHKDEDGEQPWASTYPYSPASSWRDTIKPNLADNRKNIFVSFSKFNPALRTQLVSSLMPYNSPADPETNTLANRATNFIKFYSKDNPSKTAITGDLLVDIIAPVREVGINNTSLDSLSKYPAASSEDYTNNRAISAFKYDQEQGEFRAAVTPVVAKIIGSNGIVANESTTKPGVWNISYLSDGSTGFVDSVEPINARLEFRGLTSYIKFPPPSNTPYGLIGKIILPRGYPSNSPLRIIFHLFGDATITTEESNVAFQFDYSAVCASDSVRTIIDTNSQPLPAITGNFSLPEEYVAYTALKISEAVFTIPAELIKEETVVNFRIYRVTPSLTAGSSYTGNIGIIGTYWEIPVLQQ